MAWLRGWWRRADLSNRSRDRTRSRRWSELRFASGGRRAMPRRGRNLGNFGFQRRQQRLDPGPAQVAADKNEAAATIRRRPALEPGGRMEDVLHAVDHRR